MGLAERIALTAALALIVAGVALIYVPAALMVAGALLGASVLVPGRGNA